MTAVSIFAGSALAVARNIAMVHEVYRPVIASRLIGAVAVPLLFWLGDRPWTPAEYGSHPSPVEFLFPLGVFAGFVVIASAWLRAFPRGPMEEALRFAGTGPAAGRPRWIGRPERG